MAEISHIHHWESNIRGINLLPVAVPHPTGSQHGHLETNGEKKDGKKMSDIVRARKGKIMKKEIADGKVGLVTARTDRYEEKKETFPPVCHLEQLHQSFQLHHQLPPAFLQRRHPLLQLIFPLSTTHTNPPLSSIISNKRLSAASNKGTQGLTEGRIRTVNAKSLTYKGTITQTGNRIYTSHILHLQICFSSK